MNKAKSLGWDVWAAFTRAQDLIAAIAQGACDAPQIAAHSAAAELREVRTALGEEQGERRLWVVRFDVYIKHGGDKKKPKRHIRHLIVLATDDEEAEQMARQEATSFVFGPRIAAIEWRSTCSRPPVVDMTAWALARHEPGRAF